MILAVLVACALQGPGPGSKLPNLARGADGAAYLSWVEEDGERASLHFAVRNPASETWGPAREIARGEDWFVNWADFPSMNATSAGALSAHWLEKLGDGTYAYGIRLVLSQDGGDTWSEPVWLHEDLSPVEHGFASIVPLDGETFGAVWLDGRAGAGGPDGHGATALYYRTISTAGKLGEEVLLDERVCDCCPTSLVRTRGGVLYAAYRDRSKDEIRDISVVRLEDTWSAPLPVHADDWEMPGCPVNGPRLAVAGDELAVAWYTGAGGGAGRVLLAFLEGEAFGEPLQIDDGAPIGRVDLASVGDDAWIVTWLEHTGQDAEWRGREVRGGESLPALSLATVDSDRSSGHLRIVTDRTRGSVLTAHAGDGRVVSLRCGDIR